MSDALYSVDLKCTRPLVHSLAPGDTLFKSLALKLLRKQYGNLILRRNLAERSWFSTEAVKSGDQLYREWVVGEARQLGLTENETAKVAEECVVSEPRWCVESNRLFRSRFWDIISSNPVMLIGTALAGLGFVGSFLFRPIAWLWRITGGRLWAWVKSGK